MFTMWCDYYDQPLFSSRDQVGAKLRTVVDYAESNASAETRDRLRCVTHMLQTQDGQDVDAASVFFALAQNGGVCHVQKEVGIRAVYADMLGMMKGDLEAQGVPALCLRLAAAEREAIASEIAENGVAIDSSVKKRNTHQVIPRRNVIAEQVGLPAMADPNAGRTPTGDEVTSMLAHFHRLYSSERLVH